MAAHAITFCPAGPDGEPTTYVYNFNAGRYDCINKLPVNASGCLSNDGSGNYSWTACSGSGGSTNGSVTAASQFSAGYYSGPGSTTTISGSSISIYPSSMTVGSPTSTTYGNAPYLAVNSSGTSQGITVKVNGEPSGGEQNQSGGVNIFGPNYPSDSKFSPALLVLADSTTNSTNGAGLLELWEQNPAHNSYLLWIHGSSTRNSDEPIRFDGPTWGIDEVNTSTDNAHGIGKWKVISSAYQSNKLQIASPRAWDNSTFEHLLEVYPLAQKDHIPGLLISPQSLDNDSGVLTSSDTSGITFVGLNGSEATLTGPLNPSGSYGFAIPSTVGSTGALWYNSGNRGKNFSIRQLENTGADFSYSPTIGVSVSTITASSATFTNVTISGTCTGSGCGSSGGASSSLAIGLGVNSFSSLLSSPTPAVIFDSNTFTGSLNGGGTTYLGLTSSVTKQGVITAASLGALTANQTITLSGDDTGSGATSIAVTHGATESHIQTFTSSVTFRNPVLLDGIVTSTAPVQFTTNTILGATTIYQNGYIVSPSTINAANWAGGGLSTCGSSSQAEGFSTVTGQWACQTITAAGIGAITGNQNITVTGDNTGSGTTAITLTAAANQLNIKTLGASSTTVTGNEEVDGFILDKGSASVTGAGGLGVTYNVNVGSITGSGLTTCGDSTHAVGYTSTTGLFSCQNVTGSGSGSGIVSPGTFTWQNQQGIVVSTITAGSTSSTALGANPYVTINSSGSTEGLTINVNGEPSGGYQNQVGALTINSLTVNGPAATQLVLADSTTDAQNGTGMLELWSNNPNHNDPKIWIHVAGHDSSPELRMDAYAPNVEQVNLSTDNAHGLGKWEPMAQAYQGTTLQVNSRSWDNSAFETVAEWNKLSAGVNDSLGAPGLYLHAQSLTNDSGIISSSDTAQVEFYGLNGSAVGLTGPLNPSASYSFGLPDTVGAAGQIWYNSGSRGGNFSVRQIKQSTDMTYSAVTGLTVSTVTASSATFTNMTATSTSSLQTTTFNKAVLTPSSGKSSSYVMNCQDSVIFASSTFTTISTVTLPSATCGSGMIASIYKSDQSTTPVIILPASGNSVVGVSSVSLVTYGMADQFISDGVSVWYPYGKLHHPNAFMGNNEDIAAVATLVASTTYSQAWNLEEPCDVKNVSLNIGTGGGNMAVAIYDEFGNVVLSSGPFLVPGTGIRTVTVPRTNLRPGLYYLAFGFSTALATVSRYASNLIGSGTGMYSKSNGMDATTGRPVTSLGYPPSFDNSSTRSPAVTWACYNGAP